MLPDGDSCHGVAPCIVQRLHILAGQLRRIPLCGDSLTAKRMIGRYPMLTMLPHRYLSNFFSSSIRCCALLGNSNDYTGINFNTAHFFEVNQISVVQFKPFHFRSFSPRIADRSADWLLAFLVLCKFLLCCEETAVRHLTDSFWTRSIFLWVAQV